MNSTHVCLSTEDIRESMKKDLPEWFQPFLTLLTAKPYAGQKSFSRTAFNHLLTTVLALGIGVSISSFGVTHPGLSFLLILPGWFLTVHGSRKLRLTIQHAAAHCAVSGNAKIDNCLGEAISVLTLTLDFQRYQQGHVKIHHSGKLLKPSDETYEYLIKTVGLQPGAPVRQLWRQLLYTLVSPIFHVRQGTTRLLASFLSPSALHNFISFVCWSTILGFVAFTNSWLAFVVAWAIPITIFFEISSCLRQCVEHRWPNPYFANKRNGQVLGQMTAAIFLGERTPNLSSSASFWEQLVSWSRWWLRLLLYHFPSRALVLTGDTPCHDFHHRHPSSKEWTNAIFERQRDLEAGNPGWLEPYIETWGLLEAINVTLKSLSQQSPIISEAALSR